MDFGTSLNNRVSHIRSRDEAGTGLGETGRSDVITQSSLFHTESSIFLQVTRTNAAASWWHWPPSHVSRGLQGVFAGPTVLPTRVPVGAEGKATAGRRPPSALHPPRGRLPGPRGSLVGQRL